MRGMVVTVGRNAAVDGEGVFPAGLDAATEVLLAVAGSVIGELVRAAVEGVELGMPDGTTDWALIDMTKIAINQTRHIRVYFIFADNCLCNKFYRPRSYWKLHCEGRPQ
jgi:hypothetical protein